MRVMCQDGKMRILDAAFAGLLKKRKLAKRWGFKREGPIARELLDAGVLVISGDAITTRPGVTPGAVLDAWESWQEQAYGRA